MKDLRVSIFQVCSDDSFQNNSQKILELLKVHDLSSVDLCVFPENALYISVDKKSVAPKISFESSFFKDVCELAKNTKTAIHLGSIPVYKMDGLYNSTVFVDGEGNLSQPYDKIHLFAAKIGPLDIDEAENYKPGYKASIVEVKGWKIGLSICFDLRFPELYLKYAKEHCDLILVPSAFFRKTGEAHWETLLRARAIESQAYVLAPGQVGVHVSTETDAIRKSYGHSLAVHPWGNVMTDLGGEHECSQTVVLEAPDIEKIRNSVFMKRRL